MLITYGRLIQLIGGNQDQSLGGKLFGIPYLTSATIPGAVQTANAGEIQVWRIANLTGDTHPMHIHLVNWQIISRQPFDHHRLPDHHLHRPGPGTGPE